MNPLIKYFDPQDKKHVYWLKRIYTMAKANNMAKMIDIMADNPMNVKVDKKDKEFALGCIELHFGLGMKYAEHVLDGTAWTPEKNI